MTALTTDLEWYVRKILIGVAGALGIIIAGALIIPSFIDWNRFKGEIEQQAAAATGRAVTIEGDIGFSVLPTPALSVHDIRLANSEGSNEPVMLSLRELDAQVSLLPLLSGKIEVATFRLIEPVLYLEVHADGSNNWTFTPDEAATADTENAAQADSADETGDAPDIRLDEVLITDGIVTYRDVAANTEFLLTGVDVNIFVGSLRGPFRLAGALEVNDVPLALETSVGTFESDRAVPVNATLEIGGSTARMNFRGSIAEPGPNIRVNGAISVAGPNLAEFATVATVLAGEPAPSSDLPAGLSQPYRLELEITAASEMARFRDVLIELGASSISGSGAVDYGEKTTFDVEFSAGSVDLDSWLTDLGKGGDSAKSPPPPETATADASAPPFSLPETVSGQARFSAEAVSLNDGLIRNVTLDLAMADSTITLRELSAQMPGSSDIRLQGTVTTEQTQPTFNGTGNLTAESLRNLLTWAGADVQAVPADRLARLEAQVQLQVTPELAQLYNITAKLDSSNVTGGIAYALRDRPSFGIELTVDRFNADAYVTSEPGSDSSPSAASRADTMPGTPSPLELLDTFDSNFKFAVGALTFRGVPVIGIKAEGQLVGGSLMLENGSVADIAGTALSLSAAVSDLSSLPQGSVNLRVASNDIGGISRLADITLPVPGAQMGKADIRADVTLAKNSANANIDGRLGNTRLKLQADMDGPPPSLLSLSESKSTLRGEVALDNPSLAAMIGQFDLPLTAPIDRAADAPVHIGGTLSGNFSALNANLEAGIAQGKATVNGQVKSLMTAPTATANIALKADNMEAFLRGLGVDFKPAARNLGSLSVSGKLAGNAAKVSLDEVAGNIGPVALKGSAQATLDGAKPYIRADLATSEILIDLFLPVAATGAGAPGGAARPVAAAPAAGPPWSRQPLDLAVLDTFDADISLRAAGISLSGYDVQKPKLTFGQRNGLAELSELTGTLYGGAVDIKASLQGGGATPQFAATMGLRNADIEAAANGIIGKPLATGRFNMNAQVQATGASEFALISNLDGTANIAATNGVFRGIDLPALSERLGNLNRAADFLGLVGGAFSGGQTGYTRFEVPIIITKGIARTGDVVVEIEAAAGDVSATIDLPRYELDSQAHFALSEHPDAPPLRIYFKGPLDNPRRNIGTREIEAYFTQRILSDGLGRLLGGDKTTEPPAQEGDQSEQPPETNPDEQILRDVLQGVFGR